MDRTQKDVEEKNMDYWKQCNCPSPEEWINEM